MPSQEEVDKFFTDTQNEMHYLASKPVMGQKGDRVRSEIEPWDEYDLSNWNALVKKNNLSKSSSLIGRMGDRSLNELDSLEDPVMAKLRRRQMQDDKEKAKQAHLDRKYGKSFMDKLEAEIVLKQQLDDLKSEREQIMIDMEQEAEPEGGEIADEYGSRLNDIDSRMGLIQKDIDDLRMYESVNEDEDEYVSIFHYYDKLNKDIKDKKDKDKVNEDRYLKNQDSYIRITEPRFIMDKNNPNFLFVRIDYDTGPGVGMALGKETMAGQIRRLSSAEALRQADEIGRKLSKRFDLEDLEIVDMENGTVELFAVSDDFIDMDSRSELSMGLLNEEFKVGDKVTYLGHPAVVTATKEYNGRDFVSVSYDKGNGATKARMILATSGDVKPINELELDVTDSGNPETTGDEAIERESASPAFESKLTTIYKSIKK